MKKSIKSDETLVKAATYGAVGVSLIMIVLKSYAWYFTGSVSLLSSLVDSVVDNVASVINLFAVRRALEPADHDHRFGHSKAEPLAALGQSVFIIGSSFVLLYQGGRQLWLQEPIQATSIGLNVMMIATVFTFGLVQFQRHVIKKTRSLVIEADSLHYQTDFLMNMAVIATLGLSYWYSVAWLDGVCGIVIGIYIFYTAIQLMKTALDILMDRELPDAVREELRDLALAHPQVQGVHDLRTRSGGTKTFAQFHLEVDGKLSLFEAHHIAQEVEKRINEKFPTTEVLIHQDPR